MKKRIGIILVCILLILSSSVIVYPSKALKVNGNTIYVGGSGPGNYTRIQDAIDNASSGDTIFVYNGVYNESLDVYKSINLIGEDKNDTIISLNNSRANGVYISANQVVLSGFKIQFYGDIEFADTGVEINRFVNYAVIRGNNIINNRCGVFSRSSSNRITGNTIMGGGGYGILLHGSSNIVDGNNISCRYNSGGSGINIMSSYNTITRNYFLPGDYYGIDIGGASYNNIVSNDISYLTIGITLNGGSSKNQIIGNEISHNTMNIIVYKSTHNNFISKNNFKSSSCVFYKYFFDKIIWYNNYWGVRTGIGPKLIHGYLMLGSYYWWAIDWFDFDWHPAKEPYDITIPDVP